MTFALVFSEDTTFPFEVLTTTWYVKENVPVFVGVPVSTTELVEAFHLRETPAGSFPDVTLTVTFCPFATTKLESGVVAVNAA